MYIITQYSNVSAEQVYFNKDHNRFEGDLIWLNTNGKPSLRPKMFWRKYLESKYLTEEEFKLNNPGVLMKVRYILRMDDRDTLPDKDIIDYVAMDKELNG